MFTSFFSVTKRRKQEGRAVIQKIRREPRERIRRIVCTEIAEFWPRGQRVHKRPLFILGHPRTGTTLLHNLLSLDVETFGVCSTFCAGFPSSFLWFERFKSLLSGMCDSKRPMDDMELSLDVPQEVHTHICSHIP